MEEFLKLAAGFLGGGLFTTLVFIFAQSNKITSIETRQKSMESMLTKHCDEPVNTCPMHLEAISKIVTLSANQINNIKRVDILEGRVDGLEREVSALGGQK